jgi:hypothetical protein
VAAMEPSLHPRTCCSLASLLLRAFALSLYCCRGQAAAVRVVRGRILRSARHAVPRLRERRVFLLPSYFGGRGMLRGHDGAWPSSSGGGQGPV